MLQPKETDRAVVFERGPNAIIDPRKLYVEHKFLSICHFHTSASLSFAGNLHVPKFGPL